MGNEVGNRSDERHPLTQFVEFAGTESVGGHDSTPQHVEHGFVVRRFGKPVGKAHQLVVELPPDSIRFGVEVPEEGATADARRRGDVINRGFVVTLTSEEFEGEPRKFVT